MVVAIYPGIGRETSLIPEVDLADPALKVRKVYASQNMGITNKGALTNLGARSPTLRRVLGLSQLEGESKLANRVIKSRRDAIHVMESQF